MTTTTVEQPTIGIADGLPGGWCGAKEPGRREPCE